MMRIVFLCGALEPGRDGVGDYTRNIALGISGAHNEVAIISLHDPFVNTVVQVAESAEEKHISTLRLPALFSWKDKVKLAVDFINGVDPDIVSLQYVPYSFHKKGLEWFLPNYLKQIGKERYWHIMFHELRCGMEKNASLKVKIMGELQKWNLIRIVKQLKPVSIFTNIESYQTELRKYGIESAVVPVFGNIAQNLPVDVNTWNTLLATTGLDKIVANGNSYYIIGLFGSIYPSEGLTELFRKIISFCKSRDKQPVFLVIGHGRGLDINTILNDTNIITIKTGALEEGLLNKTLFLAQLGIMTTPADGLNKSGSALAWLDRKIPILISGEDDSYTTDMKNLGVYKVAAITDIELAMDKKWQTPATTKLDYAVQQYALLPKKL